MKYVFLKKVFLENKFLDFEEAKLSVATNALHFGTSAWGGMRVAVEKDQENGKKILKLFRFDEHIQRLYDGAQMLYLDEQETKRFSREFIKEKILEFIKENSYVENDFYIRPLIYASGLGPMPTFSVEKDFLIYGTEFGNYLNDDGISVCVSSLRRQEDIMIPARGKIAGAYYISCAAKTEAQIRGFDDAIMLTQNGKVSEGSAMNIFMVRDGKLITPVSTEGILEGITRKSVIEIAEYLGIEVIERQVDLSELMYKSEEVFFTGTAARLTKCKKIEHINLNSDFKIFNKIKTELGKIYNGESKDFQDWITKLEI